MLKILVRETRETRRYARLLLNLADYALLRMHSRGRAQTSLTTRKRRAILVVKLDGIGDYVIFSRTSWIYRRLHPGAEIVLLCRPATRNLAEANENFDRILTMDVLRMDKDRPYQRSMMRALCSERFDVVYQPTCGKTFWSEVAVKTVRAEKRIAVAGANRPRELMHWYLSSYDEVFPTPQGSFREVDLYDAFARRLLSDYEPRSVRMWFDRDRLRVQQLIDARCLPASPYCVLFPGASVSFKRWPTRKWVRLGRSLRRLGLGLVLAGGPGDTAQNDEIASGLGPWGVYDLTGLTSLRELAVITADAEVLVSVDTVAVHLAAALTVPNVSIMGGGHWGRFYPYGNTRTNRVAAVTMDCFGCDWDCTKNYPDCVERIPVGVVWQQICRLLGATDRVAV